MALSKGRPALCRRYPKDLRVAAIVCARRRVARGEALGRIARGFQITWKTLSAWLSQQAPAATLEPVRIAPPQHTASPVLITPQGVRIEGLDIVSIAELLRALA